MRQLIFLCVFILIACRKDSNPLEIDNFDGVITSINPTSGHSGDTLTVNGSGFGFDPSSISVYVNGKKSTIVGFSDTLIRLIVPVRAGIGLVSVSGSSGGISGPLFEFKYRARVELYSGSPGLPGRLDGPLLQSRFRFPMGICSNAYGILFIADSGNHAIRRIIPQGSVNTFAGDGIKGHVDGFATISRFNQPTGICINNQTSELFIADRLNHCIRRITNTGDVSTAVGIPGIAGYVDAPGASARLNKPISVVCNPTQSEIYIGDAGNFRIRKFSNNQVLSTFIGNGMIGNTDGNGESAAIGYPSGFVLDSIFQLFMTDGINHNIRRINLPYGITSTIAGSGVAGNNDGFSVNSSFNFPSAICRMDDNFIICDRNNHAIRLLLQNGEVITLAGNGFQGYFNGDGQVASFDSPTGITSGSIPGEFYVTDSGNHCIRKIIIE